MKRKVINELIHWKTEDRGKPILLTGAKGVGKTYLAYDFAKAFFKHICYLNFERDPRTAVSLITADSEGMAPGIMEYFHIAEEAPAESRVLILDEINRCEDMVSLVNKFIATGIFRHIICISSNTVPEEITKTAVILPVYPLEFDEFLLATGNEWYIESILTHYNTNSKIPDIVHKELIALHRLYLQIGGMPGIINEYLNLSSVVNVSEQHNFLVGSYHDYILRDNSDSDALKMKQVFDSLVLQLMKENRKFQYKLIRKGTTHSMYKDAIQKLCDNHYIIRCDRISTEQLQAPVQTFSGHILQNSSENTNFKLFLPDTGLLYTRLVEEQGAAAPQIYRRAILENYIARSLHTKNYPFGFWESDSMAEIDFVYLKNNRLYPVEIFEGTNTRSKSISILKQKCEFPYAVKISSKNFDFAGGVKYVPYYAAFCL